jgi:hypothetical protein
MECTRVTLPNGFTGFVCGPRRRKKACAACGDPRADYECDWKLRGKQKGKTCSRSICDRCATQVGGPGVDKHLCPPHAKAWEDHPGNPKNRAKAPAP